MKKLTLVFIIICALCGCRSTPAVINVETTKSWENHYKAVNDFYFGTADIKLDKNESIWVLSNSTLSRLLKNTGR